MNLRRLYSGNRATFLFALALATRIGASALQIYFYPSSFKLPLPLVAWNDFYLTYAGWLHSLSQGMIPYRDITSYTFTPLFLYALFPFYLVGGAHAASIPIVLSDAATSPLVYLLAKRSTSQRIALAAGLVYTISPLTLFYEGYLWISSQPMTFFLVLSVYLMKSDKPTGSFAAYAVSAMFKQQAIFVLPVFLAWQAVKFGRRAWKGVGLFLLIVFVLSLPFLLVSAPRYISGVSYGLSGTLIPIGAGPETGLVRNIAGTNSSFVLVKPCPETLPTGGAPFACIRFPNPPLTFLLDSLGWISDALAIPFLLLAGVAIFLSKRARGQVELILPYSLAGFLVLFSLTVHVNVAYYFVPFYALLFSAAVNRSGLLISLLGSAASLILPTGNFPLVVALATMLIVVGVQDQVSQRSEPTQSVRNWVGQAIEPAH